MPEVESLWARFGLEVDAKAWSKGNDVLKGFQKKIDGISKGAGLELKKVETKAAFAASKIDAAPKTKRSFSFNPSKESSKLVDSAKAAIAGYLGVKGVESVYDMVTGVAELAGGINDLSQSTGIATEDLQQLAFAAQLNGTSLEEATAGASKLAKTLSGELKAGKGDTLDYFKSLGFSTGDIKKKLSSSGGLTELLSTVSEDFKAMPDGIKKSNTAIELFGKSGTKLIPLLNSNLAETFQQAKDVGYVLSKDGIESLDSFGDEVDTFKMSLQGLKQSAVVALLPTLRELIKSASEWISQNRELVSSTIQGVVTGIAYAFQGLGKAISVAATIIRYFIENAELGKSVITALGVIMAAFAIKAAAAWIIAAAPIIAIIAAITAVVLGIRWLIQNSDKVKAAFSRMGRGIADAFSRLWENIKSIGARIRDFFIEDIPNAIKQAFNDAVDALKQAWQDFLKFLDDKLPDTVKSLRDRIIDVARPRPADDSVDSSAPSRPSATVGPARVIGGDLSFIINSATGDPTAIGNEVSKRVQEHMDNWLSETKAVVG